MTNKIDGRLINKAKQHISSTYTEEEMEQKPFIKLHCMQDKYDDEQFKVFVSLDKGFIASGGLRNLSPTALKVLLVIASFTDSEGYSWISQEKIGELVGITRQQVGKVINTALINKEFGGKVLLKAVKLNKGEHQSICVYNPVNCYLDKVFVDSDSYIFEGNDYNDNMELIK
ncbi:MAG: helix-turn-helix domain-containing protein [Solibacillus sp.]